MVSQLSNPFSTGGGGHHFEAHIQASFILLMLTGGYAPAMPCWPISKIKLQGRVDGYYTDDLIVFVTDHASGEQRKLLAQIKHKLGFTKGDTVFKEVLEAAWQDFNNPRLFTSKENTIALITGPLKGTDLTTVPWLLEHARHSPDATTFFRDVKQANFSPSKSQEKLEAIQHHLKAANRGNDLDADTLLSFLQSFHVLSYDLGGEAGVVLPLLHSHISLFNRQYPKWLWSRLVDYVQSANQHAGVVEPATVPDDILETFKEKTTDHIPAHLKTTKKTAVDHWNQHPDATLLLFATIAGGWNGKNDNDKRVISQLLGTDYNIWQSKAREILQTFNSPLRLKEGVWRVNNRIELWQQLADRLLDDDLVRIQNLAITVLSEIDPVLDLPANERFYANATFQYSAALREGLADGLAIISNFHNACSQCSLGKVEATVNIAVRQMLTSTNWQLWASVDQLLPSLAEAAPKELLAATRAAFESGDHPFNELYAQEEVGVFGRNYTSGLLRALESIAWEENSLVPSCVLLADLASRDPGGKWANRPSSSLADILLPWMPHTLASFNKREAAVKIILDEQPQIGWDLLLQLLPNQRTSTSGTQQPKWRIEIPSNWKDQSHEDFWEQSEHYSELAAQQAKGNTSRLLELIDVLDHLMPQAFDHFLDQLLDDSTLTLPEEDKEHIWRRFNKFIRRHRRFSDAKWALPATTLERLDTVANQIAPTSPFLALQETFSSQDFDLYEESGDWDAQALKFDQRRTEAMQEIVNQYGVDSAIEFAESVVFPQLAGTALGAINNADIETALLPNFLGTSDVTHRQIIDAYIWRCRWDAGWSWCNTLDHSKWNDSEKGRFLSALPFQAETWDLAEKWLTNNEVEYWKNAVAHPSKIDKQLNKAVDKLLRYNRPSAALDCLWRMQYEGLSPDVKRCITALLNTVSSQEKSTPLHNHSVTSLIKYLQTSSTPAESYLIRIEWAYLALLRYPSKASPVFLQSKLATDPTFFCEILHLIFSPKNKVKKSEASEEQRNIATNALHLFKEWKQPPGCDAEGNFNPELFRNWIEQIKSICGTAGTLDVALVYTGQILIFAPEDSSGLWINKIIAKALNDKSAESMRNGYRTAWYNSRGAHTVDPSGRPEEELAATYKEKADAVENEGFHRLAATLKGLADSYRREAERVRTEFSDRTPPEENLHE